MLQERRDVAIEVLVDPLRARAPSASQVSPSRAWISTCANGRAAARLTARRSAPTPRPPSRRPGPRRCALPSVRCAGSARSPRAASTPAARPCPSTTGAWRVSLAEEVGERRRGGCRRAPTTGSRRRADAPPRARSPSSARWLSQPVGRRWSSTSSGIDEVGVLRASGARRAVLSPTLRLGRLPEIDVPHALEGEPLERTVRAHEVLDKGGRPGGPTGWRASRTARAPRPAAGWRSDRPASRPPRCHGSRRRWSCAPSGLQAEELALQTVPS